MLTIVANAKGYLKYGMGRVSFYCFDIKIVNDMILYQPHLEKVYESYTLCF